MPIVLPGALLLQKVQRLAVYEIYLRAYCQSGLTPLIQHAVILLLSFRFFGLIKPVIGIEPTTY